jgi:hypothetical protein
MGSRFHGIVACKGVVEKKSLALQNDKFREQHESDLTYCVPPEKLRYSMIAIKKGFP